MMQQPEQVLLSTRQAEIAELVASGKSTREIALALTLSPRTVETHIAAIYNKYGVSSRAELIVAVLGPGRSGENPAAASDAVKTNLPARRAALLGRETDVANIRNLMQESRLVTLTGAGGVGKTRVALAVGETVLEDFKAGVWFVELAPLARGSSVGDAIVRALSIEPSAGRSTLESLRLHLKQKSLMLILDNCEHLITEAATVADALLRDCPRVRILATSREALRITGECTYRIPSLPVPSSEEFLAPVVARGAMYASIQLFTQRAQAIDHDFALTDESIPLVADICRRIDGIPLAIELAAARVNVLPLSAIAARLESHLRILAGGNRVALPRQQTMHALIDWSYDLLEPREQRIFERLSIFSGGCALSEAIAVCGDEPADEVDVVDMLSSLVDKSLVIADATGQQARYGLLQTFAQYGLEKLKARGDTELTARRHALTYTDLAEQLEAEYDIAASPSWFARSGREIANWRTALDWTLEKKQDLVLGQRLAAALRPIWLHNPEGERWLRLAADFIDQGTPPTVAAAVRYTTAAVTFNVGDLEHTIAHCHQLSTVYETLGDSRRVAQLRTWAGTAMLLQGRVAEAETLLVGALKLAREHAGVPLVARLLANIAQISFARDDADDGRAKYAEAIALCESMGEERRAAVVRSNLADAEFTCGNIDEAVQLGTSNLIALRQFGAKTDIALQLVNLAGYCIAAGCWTAAYSHAHEAVRIAKDFAHHVFFLLALHRVAVFAALSPGGANRLASAALVLGYSDACLIRLGYARESTRQREYDRVLAALRETYAEHDLVALLADGAAMTSDQTVELALSISYSASAKET